MTSPKVRGYNVYIMSSCATFAHTLPGLMDIFPRLLLAVTLQVSANFIRQGYIATELMEK